MRNAPRAVWKSCVIAVACTVSTWLPGNRGLAQFEGLLEHVPETANAMVLVDAKALFASPIAKREDWQADRAKRFEGGLTSIPPKADVLVIASEMDVEQLHANWEVAVGKMQADVSVSSLASRYGAIPDQVDSVPVVRLPDGSFVVEFPDGVFGAMTTGESAKRGGVDYAQEPQCFTLSARGRPLRR